ncbi:MAG: MarR family transcriptional regulator [Lachnospiraceae bacterium]|nr:MarR family transcriptional regulator [Lachnospiraceae bacterium]
MKQSTVLQIRAFNRFYLPAMNLLGNHYLDSEYCATEARVFFDIYEKDGCNAAYIARKMNIDKSYLSRILTRHEKSGYIIRTRSESDARAFDLHLTESGRLLTEDLIRRSNEEIGRIIDSLDDEQCAKLEEALNTVTEILRHTGGNQ